MKIGVLASGRGTNLQAIIEAIERGELHAQVAVVLSDHQEALALERARQHGIPAVFLDPKRHPSREAYDLAVAEELKRYQVEVVALAGYMRIVTPAFLARFPLRVVNIHPALLPSFPGVEAQRQAVEYGVKYSGCTVHFVDEGMDTGSIIAQAVVPVQDDDTAESLAERILKEEHRLYPYVLELMAQGRVEVRGRKVYIRR